MCKCARVFYQFICIYRKKFVPLQTEMKKYAQAILLFLFFVLPMAAQTDDLCLDGTLLFREDFGGNDPSEPRVGTDPVVGMTYEQLLSDAWQVMHSGAYLITKSGYCNGDTSLTNLPENRRSQWHLQDDHTYPDDRTRGYLMEIEI